MFEQISDTEEEAEEFGDLASRLAHAFIEGWKEIEPA